MAFPEGIDPTVRLDKLRIAFTMQVVNRIARADGALDTGEIAWLGRIFPDELVRSVGFLDDNDDLTETFYVSAATAGEVLADELGQAVKLELLEACHKASVSDGVLHETEWAILHEAARTLGVDLDVLARHLVDHATSDAPPVRLKSWERED